MDEKRTVEEASDRDFDIIEQLLKDVDEDTREEVLNMVNHWMGLAVELNAGFNRFDTAVRETVDKETYSEIMKKNMMLFRDSMMQNYEWFREMMLEQSAAEEWGELNGEGD